MGVHQKLVRVVFAYAANIGKTQELFYWSPNRVFTDYKIFIQLFLD